jgi:hypothetical protein
VTYIAAADFRERTVKPHCTNLILGETDGLDAYVDLIIAQVTTQVELDLADDFEPPNPDTDEVISVDGSGWSRLYLPRRVRSLTTVETRALEVFTVQASTTWRLRKSLNTAGTAMVEGRVSDWIDAVSLSTAVWPFGADTVRLTGKFGWAVVPDDIKRLVALRVYDLIKGNGDPLSRIVQRQTLDATITYGPSAEVADIMSRYQRTPLVVG